MSKSFQLKYLITSLCLVQEEVANNTFEIRVHTRIKTDIKIKHDRPNIFVHDKNNNEITLIE